MTASENRWGDLSLLTLTVRPDKPGHVLDMGRLVIGGIAWFGFSIIGIEIVNNMALLPFEVHAFGGALIMTLLYLGFDFTYGYYQHKSQTDAANRLKYEKIVTKYRIILGLIGFILVASIPFIWWGVIKKLAGMAQEGSRIF